MKKILLSSILIFAGCSKKNDDEKIEQTSTKVYDGKALLKQKCSKCHNIDFPPKDFKNEVAPPMMTISFHFNDWFKANSPEEKLQKQLDFISDYIINPSVKKSYCNKEMLKKYGLMPSQKGKVTTAEIRAIGEYVFTNYTPKKLAQKQKALNKLHSLPLGEQLSIKYHCTSCHKIDKDLVGPAFKSIGTKYKNNIAKITTSIKKGSKNKWKEAHGATMPPFANIPQKDRDIIAKWLISLSKK